MKQITCPSCWAKLDISPGIVAYVCEYCKTILLIDKEEITATDSKSNIIPFPTKLSYWKVFFIINSENSSSSLSNYWVDYISEQEFNKKKYSDYLAKIYVSGHIRYLTDTSFYDKFFIRVLDTNLDFLKNQSKLFVEEDEGQLKLYKYDFASADGTFDKIYNFSGLYTDWYFIQEKWQQNIEGFEGGFDFDIVGIKKSKYLNLVSENKSKILLEKLNDLTILVAQGL